MSDSMGVGAFLLWEGALVLGLVIVRTGCLRVADLDVLPVAIRRRVDRITRMTPVVAVFAIVLIVAGIVSQIATGDAVRAL